MKATEATALAKAVNDQKPAPVLDTAKLAQIYEQVRDAAQKGHRAVLVDGENEPTRARLKEDGYMVEGFGFTGWMISW